MSNNILSNEQKAQIINQRLTVFASDKYVLELNKKVAEMLGNTEELSQADEAIRVLDAGIAVYIQELSNLSE